MAPEVNAPNIKNLYFKNRVYGHHISSQNPTSHLAVFALLAKIERVFEKSRPIEPTLQDFFSSLA